MNLIHVSVSYEFLQFIPVWQNTKEKKIINKRLIITSSKILTNINLSLFHYENKNLRFPFLRAKEFSSTSISSLRRQKDVQFSFFLFFFYISNNNSKMYLPSLLSRSSIITKQNRRGGRGKRGNLVQKKLFRGKKPVENIQASLIPL